MASTWGDSWSGSWGDSWGVGDPGSISGSATFGVTATGTLTAAAVADVKQGGLHKLNLKASFKGVETEEQKRLRREAQGIIARIKKAEPEQAQGLQQESEDIAAQLQDAIGRLELAAEAYAEALKVKQAQKAKKQAAGLQQMLAQAQVQAELMQQQIEELDVAYIVMMLAAHL